MIFKKTKKGMLDEIADDIFAFFLLFITFLFVFLIYTNTSKDSLVTYETSMWETKTTQALNQYLKYPLSASKDVADKIIAGDDFDNNKDFIIFTENYLKQYVGSMEWELRCTYKENGKVTHKIINSGSGMKTIFAKTTLPTEQGIVEIELRVEEPRLAIILFKITTSIL